MNLLKRPYMKYLAIALPVIPILLFIIVGSPGSSKTDAAKSAWAEDTNTLIVYSVGDAMVHMPMLTRAKDSSSGLYNFESCFNYIEQIIKKDGELNIVNLETNLAGEPYTGYPKFSGPDEFAIALKDAGFDVFVRANNHAADKGKDGLLRTTRILDSLGIVHTGVFDNAAMRKDKYPLIVSRDGWKVAILNYSYATNGIAVPEGTIINKIDSTQMAADLLLARNQKPDAIITCMHWGNEGQSQPSTHQKAICDFLLDNGVDVIVGSHPHVIQPIEMRQGAGAITDRLVIWSLGNFISNQKDFAARGGLMVRFELGRTRFGRPNIVSVKYVPFWVYKTAPAPGYLIVPAFVGMANPAAIFKEQEEQDLFVKFIKESRSLLQKDTARIKEMMSY